MLDVKIDAGIETIIRFALEEDVGSGDLTTDTIVPPDSVCHASFVAKSKGVVAGWDIVETTFIMIDRSIIVNRRFNDGRTAETGEIIGDLSGPSRAILKGERTALNFFQRMSGIATLTRHYVDAVAGTKAVILDTRKTAPGLRTLDKMAVRIGGGQNHRYGLFDMVLIKENHIAEAGNVAEAVRRVKAIIRKGVQVEVEVRNLTELQQVLTLPVDRVLLDNMAVEQMRGAVRIVNGKVPLEASGNITLQNVAEVAGTGVDYISVGALTHSVSAMDISLLIDRK